MKSQLKRRSLILLISFIIVIAISTALNRASFDPEFSMIDAVTGATKRAHRNTSNSEIGMEWGYSLSDLALPDEEKYIEKTVDTGNSRYVLLQKCNLSKDTLVILSDKGNGEYVEAVQKIAGYYREQGYTVEIREYSETMMLSLAHAEHFDLFLLREET